MQKPAIPKTSLLFSKETLRMAALLLATVLIWCYVEHRWTADAWQTPVEYIKDPGAVDVVALFASVKAAADGDYIPFASKTIPSLGAPFVANWNDYPNNEQIQVFLTGLLAESIGIFAAANVVMLLLYVLAAAAFYFVCRQFKCQWQWAFAGGLVFAFSPYAFAHGQHHLTLSAYWHIPLCLLVCRWVSVAGGLQWKGWRFRFAAGVAVLAGIQNVYYASMFIQLLGLGCALQLMRGHRRAIAAAIAVGGVTFATFMAMNVNTFLYHLQYGPNTAAVQRRYLEIEWTGLKFVNFLMPWQHRVHAFAEWSRHYLEEAFIRGENPPSNYLGIVGLAALAWFILWVFCRIMARPARPLPLEALQFGWIFIFATVGGVNGLLGAAGFILFRATTRYSIFLLCIVLLFLVRKLSRVTVKSPALSAALALVMTAVALWDQLPKIKTDADLQATAALVGSDRIFTEAMEARLPKGAMVFQLPVMEYPEDRSASTLLFYEHFRPYIYSQKLRFSFGSDKGRPSADWQRQIGKLPPGDQIAALEHYGFSAIYVNLRGMKNSGMDMLSDLEKSGRTDVIISPRKDLMCVLLKPDPHPAPPPALKP